MNQWDSSYLELMRVRESRRRKRTQRLTSPGIRVNQMKLHQTRTSLMAMNRKVSWTQVSMWAMKTQTLSRLIELIHCHWKRKNGHWKMSENCHWKRQHRDSLVPLNDHRVQHQLINSACSSHLVNYQMDSGCNADAVECEYSCECWCGDGELMKQLDLTNHHTVFVESERSRCWMKK